MVTVGTVVNGGFDLVRRRPLAMLVWGALYTAVAVGGSLLLLRPMMMAAQTQPGAVSLPNTFALMLPMYAMYLFLAVVLFTAALRAAVRPGEDSLASIRVGMDELRMLGLMIVLTMVFVLVALAGFVVLGIVTAVLGSLAAGGGSGPIVAIVLLFSLVIYGAAIVVQVRLSPAVALTVLRRKIVIGEAWRLTRGSFWTLFASYLVLGIMLFVVYVGLIAITAGPYFADLAQHGFTPQGIEAASQLQMARQMSGISLLMVVGWIASAVVTGLGFAVWAGAIGAATQGLLGVSAEDYAETFA
jgi:hypothetical protein